VRAGLQVVFYWTYVARHICQLFDCNPSKRPKVAAAQDTKDDHHISLSKAQETQISEIFDLFDTDGGGTIDRGELDFAMVALGFRNRNSNGGGEAEAAMEEIVADGTVTKEEFASLMMGQLSGRDPKETLRSVFALLSRSEGEEGEVKGGQVITLSRLQRACDECKVVPCIFVLQRACCVIMLHVEFRILSIAPASFMSVMYALPTGRVPITLCQVRVSIEDQAMMVQEAGGRDGTVDLRTFLSIMACSTWY
jgi:Ca2+-binding EF-hand superfamily protein